MNLSIFDEFLERNTQEVEQLADESDVMCVVRASISGVGFFFARFAIPYLTFDDDGVCEVAPGPLEAAIRIGPEYLTHVDPLRLVQVQQADFAHPNFFWPMLCVGNVRPGMPLTSVLRHLYEVLSYANVAADDGLHPRVAARLRDEPHLLDLLPPAPRLVRRALNVN